MNAVDTNVLFYAHDSRDPNKQKIAAELIASLNDGALLWQVACEYLWRAESSRRWAIRIRRRSRIFDICDAPGLRDNYSLSFLIATCLEAGVEQLFSEDFSSYRFVDSLRIVNPF
jgi:predicted nucleic acid-binding protein